MKTCFISLLILLFSNFDIRSQHINITFENREINSTTWSFDLVAEILPSYGSNNNWSTMNVRTNITIPNGVVISSVSAGTGLHPSVSTADGQSNFGGGTVPSTVKYAVALDRANASVPDFVPNSVVTLASFTVTFSDIVPGENLVTPRQFGVTAQSFWTRLGDPTPLEFGLPLSFALPITLKSFDAIKHSASSAKLDWTTSKEVNSDYFGIERSIDGSTWDEIARVKAAGDSNVDIAYDYIDDRLPLSRTNGQVFYYRLRMTDLDGAFKYSDVRGVNFDKQALGPISIYPNPTTEIVNIDLSEVVMEDGDVYVSVYDMSGRLVMTKQIIGSGIELIKVDQLPSDAYNFIIRQGEQIHQQRVIKID